MSGRAPWPNEKSAMCFGLRIEGYSYGDIAFRMGITRNAVAGYLWRHGVIEAPELARWHQARQDRDIINTRAFQVPDYRDNDDALHLTLLLTSLQELRASA